MNLAVSITSWKKNSLYFGSAKKRQNSHFKMVAVHCGSHGTRDPNLYNKVLVLLQIPQLCKFI